MRVQSLYYHSHLSEPRFLSQKKFSFKTIRDPRSRSLSGGKTTCTNSRLWSNNTDASNALALSSYAVSTLNHTVVIKFFALVTLYFHPGERHGRPTDQLAIRRVTKGESTMLDRHQQPLKGHLRWSSFELQKSQTFSISTSTLDKLRAKDRNYFCAW